MRRIWWRAIWMLALGATLQGSGPSFDPKQVGGSWKPFPADKLTLPDQSPAWLTRVVVKTLGAHLAEIADVFHRTPFLSSPVGWVMFLHPEVHLDRSWAHSRVDPRWAVAGRLRLGASNFEPDGRTVYDTASAFAINVTVNDVQCALDNQSDWATDAAGPMFLEVETPAERVHGFPRYQHCVLITARPGPMFVPVPLARAIRVRLAAIEKRIAELKGVMDVSSFEPIVKELRARVSALSVADGRRPAFATSANFLDDPLTFDQGRRIVEANPDFFDPARPSDVQVLTLFNDCVHDDCVHYDVVQKLIDQLDWKAIQAIVR